MKGLILKDVMCLKHQLRVFVFVIIGVVFTSILFVLSARYGNLAMAGKEMLRTEQATDIDVKNLASVALVLFMLLPIATVGDMANVFEADGKAGFYRLAGALPLPISKRLLARFLAIYALFGIGTLLDVILAFILSRLTDLIRFRDFLAEEGTHARVVEEIYYNIRSQAQNIAEKITISDILAKERFLKKES